MANCHLCGTYIAPREPHYRREVYSGSSSGVGLSWRGNAWWTGRRYTGIRTLCLACAQQVDAARAPGPRLLVLLAFVVLGVLAFALFH